MQILKSKDASNLFIPATYIIPLEVMLTGWLDLIYPKKCLGCGSLGKYFCDTCLKKITLAPDKSYLFDQILDLDGVVSLFEYRGLTRLGIHRLKYRFLTDSQSEWRQLIRSALGAKLSAESGWRLKRFFLKNPAVVPVPLYWRRHNWRGFNQAEIIARMLSFNLKLTLKTDLVKRIKSTQPQVGLTRRDRLKNLRQAFTVTGKSPRSVLIVDDVWTSGSTIGAVARVLRKAGAKNIWALTLAR